MNIVCATDDNFVQHCCIMLTSLLINNNDVDIYILTEGLTKENRRIIEEEVAFHNGSVHFVILDDGIADSFPISKASELNHISKATYNRLFVQDVLPQSIEKVIYFDCDIIINQAIQDFWDIDISNYAIGAVRQIGHGRSAERLNIPIEYGYFNAGVLLMNVKKLRELHATDLYLQYLQDHIDIIKANDQDVLNGVFYDKCLHLMPMWNMHASFYPKVLVSQDIRNGIIINDYRDEIQNAEEYHDNPVVIHFVSKPKPWEKNCLHPLWYYYYDYALKTLHFRDIKAQSRISRGLYIGGLQIIRFLAETKNKLLFRRKHQDL